MALSSTVAPLRIEPYTSAHRAAFVSVFNRLTAAFAYVAELSEALFEQRVASKYYFDPQSVLIGYRGDEPLGIFHATFAPPNKGKSELDFTRGNIRILLFPPDDIALGDALLDAGLTYLRSKGAHEILGWSSFAGYPFYKGLYMGTEPVLAASLPHVIVRLVQKGFVLNQHSIFLARPLPSTPFPLTLSEELELEHAPLPFSSDWQKSSWDGLDPQCITAKIAGQHAGQLIWSLLPDLDKKRGWSIGSIASLYVNPQFQRRGIAKALVAASLNSMIQSGAREATVATTQDNTAALLTYYASGFAENELLLGYIHTVKEASE